MADVVISGDVSPDNLSIVQYGTAQVAITQGQSIYPDLTNGGNMNLADADLEASAQNSSVAINTAAAGSVVGFVSDGEITVSGAPFTQGEVYAVSATAGGIAPIADLTSGDYVTLLGVASSTSVLKVRAFTSGVAKS